MMRVIYLTAAVLFSQYAFGQNRPVDPFIFRAVLPNNKVRMIVVALNPNMTAIYDGTTSGLYQIWDDIPEDGNATYGHREWGSTYEPPNGSVRTTINDTGPWDVGTTNANVRYMGYSLNGNVATLKYNITLSNNQVVQIEETPEYQSGGGISLVRQFVFSGIPQGTSLRLRLSGNGSGESWSVSGSGSLISSGGTDYLTQTTDGQTTVTGTW